MQLFSSNVLLNKTAAKLGVPFAPSPSPPSPLRPLVSFAPFARANYGSRLGKFELDLDDGEVRFQISQILVDDAVGHLTELATIGEEYEVDPIADLRPVCPNCHAVLHSRSPALSISKLRKLLAKRRGK